MSSSSRITKLFSGAAIIQVSDGAAYASEHHTIASEVAASGVAIVWLLCLGRGLLLHRIREHGPEVKGYSSSVRAGGQADPGMPESPQAWEGRAVSIAAWPALSVPCQLSLEVSVFPDIDSFPTRFQPSFIINQLEGNVSREPRRRQSSQGKGQALLCLYSWSFHESSIKAVGLWKHTGFRAREMAWLVKLFLHRRENPSPDPQHTCKSGVQQHTSVILAMAVGVESRGSLELSSKSA